MRISGAVDNAATIREHTVELDEAARYLCIAQSTLRKRAAAGKVLAYKPGRRWVFLPSELETYLRASAPPPLRPVTVALLRSASSPQERAASDLARQIRRERSRVQ